MEIHRRSPNPSKTCFPANNLPSRADVAGALLRAPLLGQYAQLHLLQVLAADGSHLDIL